MARPKRTLDLNHDPIKRIKISNPLADNLNPIPNRYLSLTGNQLPLDISFSNLSITTPPDIPLDVSTFEEGVLMTEERIVMVRRKFIHVKREARRKFPCRDFSFLIISEIDSNVAIDLAEEASPYQALKFPMIAIFWNFWRLSKSSAENSLRIYLNNHHIFYFFSVN